MPGGSNHMPRNFGAPMRPFFTIAAPFVVTFLNSLVGIAAEPTIAGLKADIPFAKVGEVSLTLDAFVPEGKGPFPTCILVHGGGFTKGDKHSFIKPLFEPLS